VQDDLESGERQIAQKAFTAYQLWVQANDAFEQQRSIIEKTVRTQETLAAQTFQSGGISERDLLSIQIDALQLPRASSRPTAHSSKLHITQLMRSSA
jgi:hypothetical protein